MERRVARVFLLSLILFACPGALMGQSSDNSRMEKLLDQVDRPGSWPALSPSPRSTTQAPANSSLNPGATFGGGAPSQPQNLFTPRNILRALMGAPPQGTKSGSFSSKRGNVEENLQTARDQASRAESACERASSGSDKEARMSAAEEARYAASAAREAADRASGQAENTTGDIADLAAQARGAADQAQAAADRATANAEGGGW